MFFKSHKFKVIVLLFIFTMVMSGCGLKQGNPEAMAELSAPITLRYWRVFDGQDAFSDIINAYRAVHPNVNIEYRKLRYEEYEKALLEAWAEDRGPDIFSIHNTWLAKYESKILPMPDAIKLAVAIERDKRSGEVTKADYRTSKALSPIDARTKFVEAAYQDMVRNNKIMALPLSVDTLALFYNRTMFDNAQITKIPATWLEVKEAVKKMTVQDDEGKILQAGIALGGADNINRASDVVSLLMMQNGAQMTAAGGQAATFNQASEYSDDKNYRPGMEALRFYTDFAMPSKEVYSWSEEMEEASQAFIAGKLAMMLGYAYQLPLIKTQGAKINLGVAEVPHINVDGTDALGYKINMASYWVETVAKKTKYANYGWDFLQFAASEGQVKSYLTRTKKPTALRALVNEQLADYDIKPFASQVLTAKSWYGGRNPVGMEEIFKEMIKAITSGKNTAEEAINYAAERVNQTL